MEWIYTACYRSPIGLMEIKATRNAIKSIRFCETVGPENPCPVILECITQLDEYFAGKRKKFNLNLEPDGTGFRLKVWKALQEIPYGETCSYQDIAAAVGNIKACRAVGDANRRNPIPFIIPCHRVIGKNGKLVGFSSGLWRKEWLLLHEAGHR